MINFQTRTIGKRSLRIGNWKLKIGNCRRGFTLIELILYVGITVIVVVTLTRVMLTVLSTQQGARQVSIVQQELGFVMDRVTAASRRATAVLTGSSLFSERAGVLSLAMQDPAAHPTIFSLSGSVIVLQEGNGAALPLTSRSIVVDELLFRTFTGSGGTQLVKVRLQGRRALTGGEGEQEDAMTLETAVTLRQ